MAIAVSDFRDREDSVFSSQARSAANKGKPRCVPRLRRQWEMHARGGCHKTCASDGPNKLLPECGHHHKDDGTRRRHPLAECRRSSADAAWDAGPYGRVNKRTKPLAATDRWRDGHRAHRSTSAQFLFFLAPEPTPAPFLILLPPASY